LIISEYLCTFDLWLHWPIWSFDFKPLVLTWLCSSQKPQQWQLGPVEQKEQKAIAVSLDDPWLFWTIQHAKMLRSCSFTELRNRVLSHQIVNGQEIGIPKASEAGMPKHSSWL